MFLHWLWIAPVSGAILLASVSSGQAESLNPILAKALDCYREALENDNPLAAAGAVKWTGPILIGVNNFSSYPDRALLDVLDAAVHELLPIENLSIRINAAPIGGYDSEEQNVLLTFVDRGTSSDQIEQTQKFFSELLPESPSSPRRAINMLYQSPSAVYSNFAIKLTAEMRGAFHFIAVDRLTSVDKFSAADLRGAITDMLAFTAAPQLRYLKCKVESVSKRQLFADWLFPLLQAFYDSRIQNGTPSSDVENLLLDLKVP